MAPTFVWVCFAAFALVPATGQSSLSFDSAHASSTFAAGDFGASEAISTGSGYWCRRALRFSFEASASWARACLVLCSSGNHAPGQLVTWTGELGARREAVGVRLHWSVGPASAASASVPERPVSLGRTRLAK